MPTPDIPVFYDGQPGPEIRRALNEMGALFVAAIEGAYGPQGWSPVLALEADGERRVFAIVDWTGGQGTKPTLTGYLGPAGIVATAAEAFDVRGLSPGDVLTTARTLAAPDWLKCDGALYLRSSYPAVEALLPPPPADGVTWTQRTLPASADWRSVTYGNGVFVAVASSLAATSPDGITWTQRALPASADWRSVTYGNGVFVAVAFSSSIAATSPDGITWTQRTLPASTGWLSVTYGNGVFVAVAFSSSIAATNSADPTKFRVPLIVDPALCRTYIKATP